MTKNNLKCFFEVSKQCLGPEGKINCLYKYIRNVIIEAVTDDIKN